MTKVDQKSAWLMLSNMTMYFSRLLTCGVFCGGVIVNVFKSLLDVFAFSFVFESYFNLWIHQMSKAES